MLSTPIKPGLSLFGDIHVGTENFRTKSAALFSNSLGVGSLEILSLTNNEHMLIINLVEGGSFRGETQKLQASGGVPWERVF